MYLRKWRGAETLFRVCSLVKLFELHKIWRGYIRCVHFMYWHICVSRGDLNKSILKLLKNFNDSSMDKSAHYRSYNNFGTEHQLKLNRAKQHCRDSCTKMFSSKYMRVLGVKFSVGSIFANNLCFSANPLACEARLHARSACAVWLFVFTWAWCNLPARWCYVWPLHTEHKFYLLHFYIKSNLQIQHNSNTTHLNYLLFLSID